MKKVYHTMFKNSKIELKTFTIECVLLLNVKTIYETKISSSTHSNRINRINRKFFVDGSSSIVNERIDYAFSVIDLLGLI